MSCKFKCLAHLQDIQVQLRYGRLWRRRTPVKSAPVLVLQGSRSSVRQFVVLCTGFPQRAVLPTPRGNRHRAGACTCVHATRTVHRSRRVPLLRWCCRFRLPRTSRCPSFSPRALCIAAAAFTGLDRVRTPAWFVHSLMHLAGVPKVCKSPRRHALRNFTDPDLPPVRRRQRLLLATHGSVHTRASGRMSLRIYRCSIVSICASQRIKPAPVFRWRTARLWVGAWISVPPCA